jgi:hypothetical protein
MGFLSSALGTAAGKLIGDELFGGNGGKKRTENRHSATYQDIYGRRPPDLTREKVDSGKTQKKSISNNLAVTQEAGDLFSQISGAETDTLMAIMDKISPNIAKGSAEELQLSRDMMAGKFDPKDVIRHGTSRGFDMGTAGSQFANFNELRSFGVDQMGYMQKGAELFSGIQQRTAQIADMFSQVGRATLGGSFDTLASLRAHETGESDRDTEVGAYNRSLQAMPDAGLVAQQDAARMAAISGVGQPVGPQLIGPLNPSGNTMLFGGQQGYSQFGGLANSQRKHGWSNSPTSPSNLARGYQTSNYMTA